MSELLLATVISELADPEYKDGDSRQEATRLSISDYVQTHGEDALFRSPLSTHLTASCFVFNEARTHILLTLHKKGQFWVQFGGHLETLDVALSSASLRELREESGVEVDELLTPRVVEMDIHDLSEKFGSCHTHLDVAFVATIPFDADIRPSSESDELGWWPVSALPTAAVQGLGHRVARALRVILA